MDLTKEFIEEHKLEEAQVKAISEVTTSHIADLKGEWDGLADKNANAILEGAVTYVQKENNHILERNQGEKAGDYIKRFSTSLLSSNKKSLDDAKAEYDEKIKNAGSDESIKKELKDTKDLYSELQKKEASFNELNDSGIKDKYDTLLTETNSLKIGNAFNSVKPSFPDTVNTFESSTRWENFQKTVLEKNNVEEVEGKWRYINKDNPHVNGLLSDLVSKDAEITKLMEGRQQKGSGTEEKTLTDIEGVPFQVPEKSTSVDRSKLIKDHLLSKGINQTSTEYSKQFAELNDKIRNHSVAA